MKKKTFSEFTKVRVVHAACSHLSYGEQMWQEDGKYIQPVLTRYTDVAGERGVHAAYTNLYYGEYRDRAEGRGIRSLYSPWLRRADVEGGQGVHAACTHLTLGEQTYMQPVCTHLS
jgi:hypothetical protein